MKDQKSILEIESELFALVKTIINIHKKYTKGEIQENFYLKSIKSTIQELIQFNFELQDKGLNLNIFLEKMGFSEDYHMAIDIINNVANLKFNPNQVDINYKKIDTIDENLKPKLQQAVLELPGISTEITSSFITLMDALKLRDIATGKLLKKLFLDLLISLEKFPGLDSIKEKIDSFYIKIKNISNDIILTPQEQDDLAEKLYFIFKEFKNKLNL